jgi:S1-C subfamily serine protease
MQISSQLPDTAGTLVVGVREAGPADAGGLRPGDVIRSVNRQPVSGLADLISLYNQLVADRNPKVLVAVLRGNATRLAVLKAYDGKDNKAGDSDEE